MKNAMKKSKCNLKSYLKLIKREIYQTLQDTAKTKKGSKFMEISLDCKMGKMLHKQLYNAS